MKAIDCLFNIVTNFNLRILRVNKILWIIHEISPNDSHEEENIVWYT